ncbi:MAG TPA: TetR/AcrR family transcriptional regulator [Bacillota bacterium]|nr:TetR/AcrR family transcriptional regulator [Bacillota bacterium]
MLDAAARVARRDGAGAVTVSAVVAEAGVSRGGLLYHFPGKDDLLRGLVERELAAFRSVLEAGDDTAARLRAYRDACMIGPNAAEDRVAVLVALSEAPDLLASWISYVRELDQLDLAPAGGQRRTGEGMPAVVARLALDGLWLSDLVDPDRFTTTQRAEVLRTLGVPQD